MWTYRQASGELLHNNSPVGRGYSGHGAGKNNPALENAVGVGPIPQGWYAIGPPNDTKTHGPYVLALTPAKENEMYGRSGFLVHGDSKKKPGTASIGCIIIGRTVREQIWASGDRSLTVVGPLPNGALGPVHT